ncbi:MAG: GNAT family N-acetyltransferase [Myxococcales bacterium]
MATDDFVLRTPRFGLRPHRPDDVPFMVALNADPEVTRYTGDPPHTTPAQAADIVRALQRQFDERRMGRFVVEDLATGEKVGWCGLRWMEAEQAPDLGYRFFRAHWGRGIASETGEACVRYGLETLGYRRLVAQVAAENVASMRVLQKLGFTQYGTGSACGPLTLLLERHG